MSVPWKPMDSCTSLATALLHHTRQAWITRPYTSFHSMVYSYFFSFKSMAVKAAQVLLLHI